MSVFSVQVDLLLCPDEDYNTVVETSAIFDECLLKFRLEIRYGRILEEVWPQ